MVDGLNAGNVFGGKWAEWEGERYGWVCDGWLLWGEDSKFEMLQGVRHKRWWGLVCVGRFREGGGDGGPGNPKTWRLIWGYVGSMWVVVVAARIFHFRRHHHHHHQRVSIIIWFLCSSPTLESTHNLIINKVNNTIMSTELVGVW